MTPSYHYRVTDWRVIDGDTVELGVDLGFRTTVHQVFRLARINAPEMSTLDGHRAKDALVAKMCDGRPLLTVESIKTEKYGRWLGELWAGGVNMNDWLVAEGHARPYSIGLQIREGEP